MVFGSVFFIIVLVVLWFKPHYYLLGYVLFFLGFGLIITVFENFLKKVSGEFIMFLILFIIILISVYLDVRKVYVSNEVYKLKISNSSIIKNSSNVKYIGKTEKYLFLKNLKTKENIIVPMAEIKLINQIYK